jgi:hypothetical protein
MKSYIDLQQTVDVNILIIENFYHKIYFAQFKMVYLSIVSIDTSLMILKTNTSSKNKNSFKIVPSYLYSSLICIICWQLHDLFEYESRF